MWASGGDNLYGRPSDQDAPKSVHQQLLGRSGEMPEDGEGANLVSYGASPGRQPLRIVDPETRMRIPRGRLAEIWCGDSRLGLLAAADGRRSARGSIARPDQVRGCGPETSASFPRSELTMQGRIRAVGEWGGGRHYPEDIEGDDPGNHRRPGCSVAVPDDRTEKAGNHYRTHEAGSHR